MTDQSRACSVVVSGVGAYLPQRVLTNEQLAKTLQTSDDWIRTRTGIRQRHIAAQEESTSDLALHAAEKALAAARCSAQQIEAIVLATTTPENTFPATAARLQQKLGVGKPVPAYDVQAVCAGFIFALHSAWNMMRLGQAKRVLVVGAEIYSRSIIDWKDRSTCVLFGDGAGAFVLERMDETAQATSERSKQGDERIKKRGILDIVLATDGSFYEQLYIDGGAGSTDAVGHLRMQGSVVFREAIDKMSQSVSQLLARNGLDTDDVAWLVPHQANSRIMSGVARRLGIDEARVVSTVGDHGNISAATIPAALDRACEQGKIKGGDLVALTAMGGGFAWGGALIRW